MGLIVKPQIADFETVTCPAYSFLVEHPSSSRKLVFDLGVRKDWQNSSQYIVDRIRNGGWKVEVKKDVPQILEDNKIPTKDIEAVIWSHYHWDHTGDPSRFPSNTALIVGPGFKGRFPNAYPTNPNAAVREDAWAGRELREISFTSSNFKIGRFNAFDYFGDGSFYILDTPGHLLGHICGLARTTKNTFIFMGGDAAHHRSSSIPILLTFLTFAQAKSWSSMYTQKRAPRNHSTERQTDSTKIQRSPSGLSRVWKSLTLTRMCSWLWRMMRVYLMLCNFSPRARTIGRD
jgi:glyoxylase-like metal-dependent hydrolase (beta-lactamase superfamily II)